MATDWDYLRTCATARIAENEGGNSRLALGLAEEQWEEKLKELGRDGWELVSEQALSGGSGSPADPFWAEFTGTMKRQGSPL
jgi:hypothetical protein